MKLQNRTILITGASSGIGRELALQLAAKGNRLLLLARRRHLLEELLNDLKPHPHGHWIAECDVTDPNRVATVCQEILSQDRAIDIMILNSGVGGGFNARQMDVAAMRRQFDVNFWGSVYFLQHLLPSMLERGHGLVAVNGSLAGYRGMPGSAPYSASKAALSRLLESLRIDLYHSGVRFALITPGFVKTPMTDLNQYYMPFLISVANAVRIIIRGLEKEKTEIHFPYRLSMLCKAVQFLPNQLYAKLFNLSLKSKSSKI